MNLASAAAAVALLTTSRSALAFASAELVYVRDPGARDCPSEMELRLAVAHRLGYDPFHTGSRRRVVVMLAAEGDQLVARFDLVDEQGNSEGERRLQAAPDACADLVRGLALSLSIAIDPERTEPISDEPPSAWRFRPEPSASAADHPAPARAATHPPQNHRNSFRLGVGGQVASGVAPQAALGVLVTASLRRSAWSLGLEGRFDAPASDQLPQGGHFSSRIVAASLLPCFHFDPGLVCAVGSLGTFVASAEGIAEPGHDTAMYAAAGLRLGTEWPLGRTLLLRTHVDGLGSFKSISVMVDGAPVWKAPPYSASAGATLLVRFP